MAAHYVTQTTLELGSLSDFLAFRIAPTTDRFNMLYQMVQGFQGFIFMSLLTGSLACSP